MYTYIIIDDEPLIRRGTMKKLEAYPDIACAGQAADGKGALELIEEKDPDFIITDMKMPIMDGTQLLPVLSERYPEKYIIVISGYRDFDYAAEALRAKTLDYIVKPFSRETLWGAVDKAVELLKNRKNRRAEREIDEQKKESLKYEYDRQLLRSLLFGEEGETQLFQSRKMSRFRSMHSFVAMMLTLSGKVPEKTLTEFLSMRGLEAQTVLLARDQTENLYVLLMFFADGEEKREEKLLRIRELLDCFLESMSVHAIYGISKPQEDVSQLRPSYQQAMHALNRMTLGMKEHFIFYEEGAEKACILEWPKLEQFLFLVESGRTQEVETVFPELFHYFARVENCTLENAKEYCLEIVETLKRSLPRELQVQRSAATSLSLLAGMNLIFRFGELEEYFERILKNLSMAFESAGFYSEKDVLDNVKKYIDLHYEKDLTQEFLASLFRLNRSYLSSAFKARMGISFVDYVNQVRIAHAKELLGTTDKKLYQIAQAVGYENAKYFFRVFKKMEGITPEQYRNTL